MLALDFIVIIYAWLATFILQLIAAPHLIIHFKNKLVDGGWAIGRTISWLAIGLIIWFLSHLYIPANSDIGLGIIISLTLFCSFRVIKKHNKALITFIRKRKKLIIAEEILFFIGISSLSYIRMHNPDIQDLEKFMDAGFMASYLRAPTLPAPDIWLAGETINYYSFGHFLGSIMSRLWHIDLAFTYNLLLGFIMGLGLMISFSVVANLLHNSIKPKTNKPLLIGGFIGAILTIIGGNTHTIWYWITNRSWHNYWYADATRFIENTIHEFPSYSFVVSDLHAHVWSLPFVLTFLIIIQVWVQTIIKNPPNIKLPKIKNIKFNKLFKKITLLIKKHYSRKFCHDQRLGRTDIFHFLMSFRTNAFTLISQTNIQASKLSNYCCCHRWHSSIALAYKFHIHI